ncbi:hypothetical protein JCM1840_005385 [Sporobolomyces johnsonii]
MLHLPLLLAAPAESLETTSNDDSTTQETTLDGSGHAPFLHSPSFLLFAIESILAGLFLAVSGHRGWRATTALGATLLLEFLVWVIMANTMGEDGFSAASAADTGIIVWAVVTASGVVGLVLGATVWRIGVFAMGACSGLALGLSIAMMGDNALRAVARWVIIGVLAAAGLVVPPLLISSVGMAISTSVTGSFLVWLGIDLLVNNIDGMSLGLRYILDHNSTHFRDSYHPPTTTRVFLALSWFSAVVCALFQIWYFLHRRREPFIRRTYPLKGSSVTTPEHELPDFASDYRLPVLPPGLSDHLDMSDVDDSESAASRIQHRYQLAAHGTVSPEPVALDSRINSPLLPTDTLRKIEAIRHVHPHQQSSPDDPPSRPASAVSTEFADGLQSRPPTFFNELTGSTNGANTRPFASIAFPPTDDVGTSPYITHDLPIVGIGAAAAGRPSPQRRRSIPTSVPVGPDSEDGSGSTPRAGPTSSENAAHVVRLAFGSGLKSGGEASLAPTGSSPSSGDISTLLGHHFHTNPSSYYQVEDRDIPDVPTTPTITMTIPPRMSPDSERSESFRTAQFDDRQSTRDTRMSFVERQ